MAGAMQAAAQTAAPTEFPATARVADQVVRLNGSGIRYKAVFKVYEAGLYTTAPVRSTEEFFAAGGPKWLHLVARRDIGASEMGKMLVRGISDSNTRDEVNRQLVGIAQVGAMFGTRSQVATGESFGFQYLPGVGTHLLINGKAVGQPVTDPSFFNLVMRIWVGQSPVDARLKTALLGLPPADAGHAMH
jgi:Chalcone isomerase-like